MALSEESVNGKLKVLTFGAGAIGIEFGMRHMGRLK